MLCEETKAVMLLWYLTGEEENQVGDNLSGQPVQRLFKSQKSLEVGLARAKKKDATEQEVRGPVNAVIPPGESGAVALQSANKEVVLIKF